MPFVFVRCSSSLCVDELELDLDVALLVLLDVLLLATDSLLLLLPSWWENEHLLLSLLISLLVPGLTIDAE